MNIGEFVAVTDVAAVGAFAASGALAAAQRRLDVLGFVLFGSITGVGGGTLRDLLLGLPVFWIREPDYVWICIIISALTWFAVPALSARSKALAWVDALGISLFCVMGCAKALDAGAAPVVAVIMGVMSASFGGLIRDTLLGQDSIIFGPELYVTAAMAGATAYVLLALLPVPIPADIAMLSAMLPAFVLRAGAIQFGWRLPQYRR